MGETSANEGHKSDHQNDQKFNHKVPSGYDTKIGPHTGSDVAQVAEDKISGCNMVQLESEDVQCHEIKLKTSGVEHLS